MPPKKMKIQDDPVMSDTTLLVSVEDLINMAMGPPEKNKVNFKLLQVVLNSLARQMRMLETQVEIKVSEVSPTPQEYSTSSSSKSPRSAPASKGHMKDIKEESGKKKSSGKDREQAATEVKDADKTVKTDKGAKIDKTDKTENDQKVEKAGKPDKAQKGDKADKASKKTKDKREKEENKIDESKDKGQETAEKAGKKDKEKLKSRDESKERPKSTKEDKPLSETKKAPAEVERQKEVLVVEKGPTTRADSRTRVGSIEVVTLSQFAALEALVKELATKAAPVPVPALPDNRQLMTDLAKGTASLTDTMQAMQVSARVKAAEQAIGRMAGLLTQLAAAGALPEDLAEMLGNVKAPSIDGEELVTDTTEVVVEKSRPSSAVPRKSVAIDPMSTKSQTSRKSVAPKQSMAARSSRVSAAMSTMSRRSSVSTAGLPKVTHKEMDDALRALREDLTKNMNNMTSKATIAAETASNSAKGVADRLDVALKLNTRISTLNSIVSDYAVQLSGFDAGLTTQMQSFKEQMAQMRNDLSSGLALLDNVNNNAETAAVLELTERYESLVLELEHTLHDHQGLTTFQNQLADELRSLVECMEMMREQKADRDEVLDGLRDKADNSRLAGLLTDMEFFAARQELERRLNLCYDKFNKQELVWMGCLKDLTLVMESKAELMQLLAVKDDAQQHLRDLQTKQQKLAVILGEPKAAVLTRKLARDATCGSCMVPALMEPTEMSASAPPPLPALRPRPTGAPAEPCLVDWKLPTPPDNRDHMCHRWVGGSHTVISEAVTREQAPPLQMHAIPVKRYTGFGEDGRVYLMEEELKPCKECNILTTDKVPLEKPAQESPLPKDGAGDRGSRRVQTKSVPIIHSITIVKDEPTTVQHIPTLSMDPPKETIAPNDTKAIEPTQTSETIKENEKVESIDMTESSEPVKPSQSIAPSEQDELNEPN